MAGKRYEELSTDYVDRTSAPSPSVFSAKLWRIQRGSDFQEILQLQLLDAKAGDVITIPEGTHHLNRSLSLTVDGVTIRGAGMDKSILSFKGQCFIFSRKQASHSMVRMSFTNGQILKKSPKRNMEYTCI